MERTELSDEVKLFVVQALACFDTPTEVARAVKDAFDLVVSRQGVERYDPTKRAGADLSAELRAIFKATREAFLADTAEIGIAHRAVRLRKLDRMSAAAEGVRNYALAAQLLEQAAKECGGAYSNKQRVELTGADGAPVATDNVLRIEFVEPGKAASDAVDPGTGGI